MTHHVQPAISGFTVRIPVDRLSHGPRARCKRASSALVAAKIIEGKPALQFAGMARGTWAQADSPIDAILTLVERQLRVTRSFIYDCADLNHCSVSRCRHGKQPIPDAWIFRLHLFSGIPISELIVAGCIEPSVQPHHRARRAA